MTIKGEVIESVTESGAPPAAARIVDGQGKFLIPGLWDMHAHMEAAGESALQLNLAAYATWIRILNSFYRCAIAYAAASRAGPK